ncbi:hypothetical protein FB451DRAFT_1176692 [Mycena latifolia]|nr:hypothetical protein FB451DRAFT_1176692 [Mycena latifolia]
METVGALRSDGTWREIARKEFSIGSNINILACVDEGAGADVRAGVGATYVGEDAGETHRALGDRINNWKEGLTKGARLRATYRSTKTRSPPLSPPSSRHLPPPYVTNRDRRRGSLHLRRTRACDWGLAAQRARAVHARWGRTSEVVRRGWWRRARALRIRSKIQTPECGREDEATIDTALLSRTLDAERGKVGGWGCKEATRRASWGGEAVCAAEDAAGGTDMKFTYAGHVWLHENAIPSPLASVFAPSPSERTVAIGTGAAGARAQALVQLLRVHNARLGGPTL